MSYMRISKPTEDYTTVAQSIRANGDRHMANGNRHSAEGRPEFAKGSWRKAKRNYARADELERWLNCGSASEAISRYPRATENLPNG